MKKLLLSIFALAAVICMDASATDAENAFVDGTVWEMIGISDATPEMESYTSYCKLDGVREVGGYEAMLMYKGSSFVAFVRTEGDKVYWADDEENPEWYLCFDFGMKPGDEGHFYDIGSHHPYKHCTMRCISITTAPMYYDYPVLEMQRLWEGSSGQFDTEPWYIGIGSAWGPTWSSCDGWVGGGLSIQRVTNGDRVLFEKGESGIEAPTVEQPSGAVSYYNLQGARVDNPSNGVFIRVADGKTSKVLLK